MNIDMKKEFIDAVASGDVDNVRLALSNELLLDPRGKSFSEMLEYAKEKLPNLFEANKELDMDVPDKDQWNEEFLFKVKNELDANFSVEKLALYQAVIEVVGKEKASKMNDDEQKHAATSHQEERPNKSNKVVPITVTTGGAILTIVGICAGKTLLSIAGGVVLIGGVLLTVKSLHK